MRDERNGLRNEYVSPHGNMQQAVCVVYVRGGAALGAAPRMYEHRDLDGGAVVVIRKVSQ